MSLTIEHLDTRNPGYDCEFWADLNALYRGGKAFRDRIENFLPRNPMETPDVYQQRKQNATYRSYLGPIVDYYSAWLFNGDFKVRAKKNGETVEAPGEYAEFREDCGGDVDMKEFLKGRFTKALVESRSHWLCELPAADGLANWPDNAAEHEALGLRKAQLSKVDASDLLDYELGDDNRLDWAIVYSKCEKRRSPSVLKRTIQETWKLYDREDCTVFQIEYKKGERPAKETPIEGRTFKHGFKQVPLVTMYIPEGMWIANRVYDPQTAHFRLGAALDWSIKRTCYAMPVFNIEDETKPPVMGAGYYIMIGKDEKMSWAAPPAGQFDVISKEVDVQRNDIFRMTHQMALGLDNNAETVGRSADSKSQDNAATRIMLHAYGSVVSQAIEETYELISDAFGDEDTSWSIEGFAGYDTATAPEVIANVQNLQLLNIPSPTLMKEVKTKAAFAVAPEMAQDTKEKVKEEISDAIDAAGEHADLINAGFVNLQQRTSVEDAAKQAASKAKASSKPKPQGKKLPSAK